MYPLGTSVSGYLLADSPFQMMVATRSVAIDYIFDFRFTSTESALCYRNKTNIAHVILQCQYNLYIVICETKRSKNKKSCIT